VQAREKALGRAALPRVSFLSAASVRGSGASVPGIDETNGLWPHVPNWAAGISISFPIMDTVAVQPRRRVEAQNEIAAHAAYQQTLLTVTTAQARAGALYTAATAIARNMSAVLAAAQETEQRARVRYNTGLAPITEVADAQRLLSQAEADAAVARLSVWRALLAQAQAAGDLGPFLTAVR
jgi:outer membrane protein TolC